MSFQRLIKRKTTVLLDVLAIVFLKNTSFHLFKVNTITCNFCILLVQSKHNKIKTTLCSTMFSHCCGFFDEIWLLDNWKGTCTLETLFPACYKHICIIYTSGHKWSMTHRVSKSHRSKMNVIYMQYIYYAYLASERSLCVSLSTLCVVDHLWPLKSCSLLSFFSTFWLIGSNV